MDNISAVFNVDSSNLKEKYEVSATYNTNTKKIEFECNCGIQFGQEMRKKCKHIDILGINMIHFLKQNDSSNIEPLEEFNKISIDGK